MQHHWLHTQSSPLHLHTSPNRQNRRVGKWQKSVFKIGIMFCLLYYHLQSYINGISARIQTQWQWPPLPCLELRVEHDKRPLNHGKSISLNCSLLTVTGNSSSTLSSGETRNNPRSQRNADYLIFVLETWNNADNGTKIISFYFLKISCWHQVYKYTTCRVKGNES